MASDARRTTVTKKQLVATISKNKSIHPNYVRHTVQALLDNLLKTLSQGQRLELRGFGVFEIVRRKQKIGRNPRKPSMVVVVPERNCVKFTPSKRMRAAVEKGVVLLDENV